MNMVPLGAIAKPISNDRGETDGPVLSITKHEGFVRSADYFKKVVHSKDLSKYKRVERGNFAFSPIHLDEGSIALADEGGLISPMYRVFEAQADQVDKQYLIRILKTDPMVKLYGTLGDGSVHRRRSVPWERLSMVKIPLPPLKEQKRIAEILDQADALRHLRTRALDKLNTLGQSIFHEMFGENLASQRTMRLGAATSKIGSGATPRGGDSAYKPEGIPLIRSMNVRDGAFSPKGLAFIDMDQAGKLKNVVVQSNDLLLNITGASVARVCIAPETMDGARVNQHVAIIRCTDVFLPEFLEAFFLLPSVKGKLLGIAEAGATRQAITKSQIQELEVPNIGIAKQRDFVVRRHAVARQLENMLAQEKSIRSLFASFQHRAFRGEL